VRQLVALGDCDRCQKRGPVWKVFLKVLDFGTGLVMEPRAVAPTLCDDCEQTYIAEQNAGVR
jgi:hypothetical protein